MENILRTPNSSMCPRAVSNDEINALDFNGRIIAKEPRTEAEYQT
jgi:hypothetical protein